MASIRTRYGKLTIDFRYLNKRCRETTAMEDTPNNRKKLEKAIERMEAEMLLGVFDYAKYFPKSARLAEIKAAENLINAVSSKHLFFLSIVKYGLLIKKLNGVAAMQEKLGLLFENI